MMILRGGVTRFPYYDLGGGGGTVENFQRKSHQALAGANHLFLKKKRK